MLVTVGRWLVMLECERQSDQDGLRGGEAEALGGRESRWEGWIGCKQELPRREMSLYIKVYDAEDSHAFRITFHVFSEKLFLPHQALPSQAPLAL